MVKVLKFDKYFIKRLQEINSVIKYKDLIIYMLSDKKKIVLKHEEDCAITDIYDIGETSWRIVYNTKINEVGIYSEKEFDEYCALFDYEYMDFDDFSESVKA